MTGTQNVDLTTLDFSSNNYYYTQNSTNINQSGDLSTYTDSTRTTILKVKGVTKTNSKLETPNGTKLAAITYNVTGYRYTQREIESDKSDKGLYPMNDYNGTSYYYRGSVNNNYVLFGGHYWRIIRVNGDGSIRLLYSGSKKDAQGEELFARLTDSSLGYSSTNRISFNTNNGNPAYVGYMYGNTLNSSYAETHANEVDSTIKKYLDSWYRQNIEEKGYSKYMADSGFCSDRSLSMGDGFTPNKTTSYNARNKFNNGLNPSVMCPNTNDLFTTSSSNNGNKVLIYPIGLITFDELRMAGLKNGYINKLTYISSGVYPYWTMTPNYYWDRITASQVFFTESGLINNGGTVDINLGVRPVINLKAETEISGGIGTSNEPFIIN